MSKIQVVISTHQGKLYDESCEHLTVKNEHGEFAIFKDHLAICTVVSKGYVKLAKDNKNYFVSLVNALVEFNNNECTIAAAEAHLGETLDEANKVLEDSRNQRLEFNKKVNADYTHSEKEIRDNLKNTKAGSL